MKRTKISVGLASLLFFVGGCALLDAWYGEVDEPQCSWEDCACARDDGPCDPRTECTPTTCRRCESGEECEGTDLCRLDLERCSSCDDHTLREPLAVCVAGECFFCEGDEDAPNQYCVRDTCYF